MEFGGVYFDLFEGELGGVGCEGLVDVVLLFELLGVEWFVGEQWSYYWD